MEKQQINQDTVDDLISTVYERIRGGVESGTVPLSSEHTLRLLFTWELGRALGFSDAYRFDLEVDAYSKPDRDDKFLDLLVYTDPDYKVAIEFKLPKKSSAGSQSAHTWIRAAICRDIARLHDLVHDAELGVRVGYLICATDEGPYLVEGWKKINLQYKTYNGSVYRPSERLPKGTGSNAIARELVFPCHEVRFEWQGIEDKGVTAQRFVPQGRFAWLKPIKIWA